MSENTELDQLKDRAALMGIQHHPSIGVEALRSKINAKLADSTQNDTTTASATDDDDSDVLDGTPSFAPAGSQPIAPDLIDNTVQVDADGYIVDEEPKPRFDPRAKGIAALNQGSRKTRRALLQEEREKQIAEQMKLVRIRIACLNPAKKDLPGEVVTVANKFIGTVKKYIPFGEATENGYHVPYCLFVELKSRRFQSIRTKKGNHGTNVPEPRLVPEFTIEVLPQLSENELQTLARNQAAARGQ